MSICSGSEIAATWADIRARIILHRIVTDRLVVANLPRKIELLMAVRPPLPASGHVILSRGGQRRYRLLDLLACCSWASIYRVAEEHGLSGPPDPSFEGRLFAVVMDREVLVRDGGGIRSSDAYQAALRMHRPGVGGPSRRRAVPSGFHMQVARQSSRWMDCRVLYVPLKDSFWRQRKGGFLASEQHELLALAGGRCQRCGSAQHLQFDHVVALAFGGVDDVENGQVLCRDCHQLKTLVEPKITVRHDQRDGGWYARLAQSAVYFLRTDRFARLASTPTLKTIGPFSTEELVMRAAREVARGMAEPLRWPASTGG